MKHLSPAPSLSLSLSLSPSLSLLLSCIHALFLPASQSHSSDLTKGKEMYANPVRWRIQGKVPSSGYWERTYTAGICQRCERSEQPPIPLSVREDTGASCNDLGEWESSLWTSTCATASKLLSCSNRREWLVGLKLAAAWKSYFKHRYGSNFIQLPNSTDLTSKRINNILHRGVQALHPFCSWRAFFAVFLFSSEKYCCYVDMFVWQCLNEVW